MEYNRASLKQKAKDALGHTMPRPWKVTLLFLLITSIVSYLISLLAPSSMMDMLLTLDQMQLQGLSESELLALAGQLSSVIPMSLLVTILTAALSALMGYGYSMYALHVWRGQQASYADLFSGFRAAGRALGAAFMVWLFTVLWSLLAVVLLFVLLIPVTLMSSYTLALLYLYVAIFGLAVFLIWVSLRYAMTTYWIITDGTCGILEAITRSKERMRGNKRKYLMLLLSFIGWPLLAIVILYALMIIGIMLGTMIGGVANLALAGVFAGIGLLIAIPIIIWFTPYYNVSIMGFFDMISGGAVPPPSAGSGHYDQIPPTLSSDFNPPSGSVPPTNSNYVQRPPDAPGLDGTNDPWNLP